MTAARARLDAASAAAGLRGPLALLILASMGCGHGKAKVPAPECLQRADCPGGVAGGQLCVEGKCTGCTRSRECRLTELCDPVQRLCTSRACFGDECAAHADCKLGAYCVQGLCLDPAQPRAVGGQTCSARVCGSARDCNAGERCNGRTFVCEQDLGCLAGSPCAAGQVCNPVTSVCEQGCTAETAAQACGALVPCISGRCVQCAQDRDCGPGLVCDVAAGACTGPAGCLSSRDCELPKTCDRATATCALPRGPCDSNERCAADERCETRTGKCVSGACLPDRFDPNADQAHAQPISPGSVPQLTLCGAGPDWFSLPLSSGDTVQIVADTDPLGSFDLQLRDQTSVLEEGPFAVLRTVGLSATYFVRASTNDAAALYGLRVQVAPGTPCDHSPPDAHPQPSQALPLPAGPSYDFAVCPGEATWFVLRPPLAAQGIDVAGTVAPTAGGALVLSLYDSDGATLLAQDASGTASPRVAAPSSRGQQFFLRVAGADARVRNRYDLTVRVTGP